VALALAHHFASSYRTRPSQPQPEELEAAHQLVATKYGTPAWVNRLP
jgi:hypothetical protein